MRPSSFSVPIRGSPERVRLAMSSTKPLKPIIMVSMMMAPVMTVTIFATNVNDMPTMSMRGAGVAAATR